MQAVHNKDREHSTHGSPLKVNNVSNKSGRNNMNLTNLNRRDNKLMNALNIDNDFSTLGLPLQEVSDSKVGGRKELSMLFRHEMT